MNANERQVGGEHYQSIFQHWDFVSAVVLPYLPAQVTKYLTRWQKKNGRQDLEKAVHFLDKHIEEEVARTKRNEELLQKFMLVNSIQDADERAALTFIMRHHSGEVAMLAAAKECLRSLLERV